MADSASFRGSRTPEGSAAGDDANQGSSSKGPATKDKQCQYCHQAFTSSSLGRHLDQYLFKKKPDGIHDVDEIRRIRSSITRRQARTSSGKRGDSPDAPVKSHNQFDPPGATPQPDASRDGGRPPREPGTRFLFNTPTWHATGVINDIPEPVAPTAPAPAPDSSMRGPVGPLRTPLIGGDLSARSQSVNNPDTARALELALREVLDNIKAATSRTRPLPSPFDFDIQAQTFPSLCLLMLPPPPSLFSTHPFPSSTSFPLDPPGPGHVEMVREALRAKIYRWKSDQLASSSASPSAKTGFGLDPGTINRTVNQHEEVSYRHLDQAYQRWVVLPDDTKRSTWQLEIMRAFARETEKRQQLESQLARVQQEANQLRAQVERLGSCQWPREFAIFPPDMLPLSRDAARELDAMDSPIGPESGRWDFDTILAKWKRVVMHDKSMGRVGVGYANTVYEGSPDQQHPVHEREGSNSTASHHRIRTLQTPPAGVSPDSSAGTVLPPPTASAHHQPLHLHRPPPPPPQQTPPPYQSPDLHRNPSYSSSNSASGHQAKRPRLVNGGDSSHDLSYGSSNPAINNNNPPPKLGPSLPSATPTLPTPISTGWSPGSLQSLLSGPPTGPGPSATSSALSPAITRP